MTVQSNKKLTLTTFVATFLLQIVTIVSGFIVPRLILHYFGSEVNGLVSSITQFLNYVQLLEGGVSGVIMAALFKALANDDFEKVSSIVKASNNFFRKIAIIFIVYSLAVAVIYPLISHSSFSFGYVFSLSLILAFGTFVQYFFSLTFRILINADRRGYVVSLSQIVFVLINLALAIISVVVFPNIHFLKGLCAISYLIQPIVFGIYVKKHYSINRKAAPDKESLKQRWDGFGQNLAFFIHSNTDIIVLTIFTNLSIVSVYSIYLMVTNALKSLVGALSGSIKPSFANVLVSQDTSKTNIIFNYYEFGVSAATTFAFACCLCLITQFVSVYTSGLSDSNLYYQPLFGILITIAEGLYCLRDPYMQVAYCAGNYRRTSIFAIIEAMINIVVSLSLVNFLGLVGVAIGTLVAMLFRMIAHIFYNKSNVIFRPVYKSIKSILMFVSILGLSYLITNVWISFKVYSYLSWISFAFICAGIVAGLLIIYVALFERKEVKGIFVTYFKRTR